MVKTVLVPGEEVVGREGVLGPREGERREELERREEVETGEDGGAIVAAGSGIQDKSLKIHFLNFNLSRFNKCRKHTTKLTSDPWVSAFLSCTWFFHHVPNWLDFL